MQKEKENKFFSNLPVEEQNNLSNLKSTMFFINDFFLYSELGEYIQNNNLLLDSFLDNVDFEDTSYKEVNTVVRTLNNQNLLLAKLYDQLLQYQDKNIKE